jgi:hypothetical protein
MLTGRRAFQKPTSAETLTTILNEESLPISQLIPATPPALQRIMHCLPEKNVDKCFQNASDLEIGLVSAFDGSFCCLANCQSVNSWPTREENVTISVYRVISRNLTVWRRPSELRRNVHQRDLQDESWRDNHAHLIG